MAISDINAAPNEQSLNAAYRPVILRAETDGIPPVVYCDIYFEDQFYKTLSRTSPWQIGEGTLWEFDIQDAAQEYLAELISTNGGSTFIKAVPLVVRTKVYFRDSETDENGFLVPEPDIPIQGSVGVSPVPGGGTPSNEFYIVNSTLRHEDVQDLATHLGFFENGSWVDGTYPLSHRPANYKVCKDDNDYFPIITDQEPASLTINYVNADGTTGTATASVSHDDDGELPTPECVPMSGGSSVPFPAGVVGQPYSYSYPIPSGSGPYTIAAVELPSWMESSVVGNHALFEGTPDEEFDGDISFELKNECSEFQAFSGHLTVTPFENFLVSASFGMNITSVTGAGAPAVGATGVNGDVAGHHTGISGTMTIHIEGTPGLTISINVTVNGSPVDCVGVPGTDDYELDATASESEVVAIAIFSGECP